MLVVKEKLSTSVSVNPITSVAIGDIQNVINRKHISDSAAEKALLEAQENLEQTQETGYTPELRRNFSFWSLMGVGFGLTNSWLAIAMALITAVSSGGPMMIIYGIVILAAISMCTACTLSELSSAMPSAGGQYYWTLKLAPKEHAPFLAYICGAFAWAGAVFISASVTISISAGVMGMYVLGHDDEETYVQTWQVFVAYEVVNLGLVFFNISEKPLPLFAHASLAVSLVAFTVSIITVLAKSSGHYNSSTFVFAEFVNNTGWSNAGIAFIVGLINPNWAFSCLDSATHMAEELLRPEIDIPKVIFGTVVLGFLTAFPYAMAMFYCIRDLATVSSTNTGLPIIAIFYQALGSKPGAIVLQAILTFSAFGSNIQSHTWQARLCWSFSRDNGLPGSRFWSKVNPITKQPVNAHLMSCACCAVIGCIYMGSTTAYNAVVTGGIVLLYLSYIIPTICLLMKGRENIKHGPFWMGTLGEISNYVLIVWTIFTTVFYSLPAVMPVKPGNLNYVYAVIGGYVFYSVLYWHFRGKYKFKTLEDHQVGIDNLTQQLLNQIDQLEFIVSSQPEK